MEEQAPYGVSEYELPSYLEKVQSQLPALQLLINIEKKGTGERPTNDRK